MKIIIKNTLLFTLIMTPINSLATTKDLDFNFSGNHFIESNSPEVVQGSGFVFKHDEDSSDRGQTDYPLTGCTDLYFFHINKSNRNLDFHLMVKSKNSNNSKLSIKGSSYTNFERPLRAYHGQSYSVASDWIMGSLNLNKSINIDTSYQSILKKRFFIGSMIDGKFQVCSDMPYYIALVVSNSRSKIDVIKKDLNKSAPGILLPVRQDTYGRVAAIFEKSKIIGKININSGTGDLMKKWHINTISKLDKDRHLQDQTMQCLNHLHESSCQSNGNYGREYNISLKINNNTHQCRRYKISFGSNFKAKENRPSFTWNCPIQVDNMLVPVYTTPTKPTQLLKSIDIQANSKINIPIHFMPCGLITAKQNLQIEEVSCDKKKLSRPMNELSKYKKAVQQLINGSYERERYSKEGHCLDYGTNLLYELQMMGFKNLQLAETTPKKLIQLNTKSGKKEQADRIHFFLVDRVSNPKTEIIIDPTYLQFFNKKELSPTTSPIFVGTKEELIQLYKKQNKHTGWQTHDGEPINPGKYKSEELSCLRYSFEMCAENRINH